MKFFSRGVVALAGLLTLSLLLTCGCRSTPKVNWSARVGSYTYDQAVTELGPPDKSAKLDDGRTVAEWVTGYKQGSSFSFGTGMYGGHGGVAVGQTVGGGSKPRILRLTFDPEGRLAAWTKQ
jgi:hypothetical protein